MKNLEDHFELLNNLIPA